MGTFDCTKPFRTKCGAVLHHVYEGTDVLCGSTFVSESNNVWDKATGKHMRGGLHNARIAGYDLYNPTALPALGMPRHEMQLRGRLTLTTNSEGAIIRCGADVVAHAIDYHIARTMVDCYNRMLDNE